MAGGIGYGVNAMAMGVADLDLNEDTGVAGVALKVFGLSFPICLIGFGLLLLTMKAVPAPAALALSLGGLLFAIGRDLRHRRCRLRLRPHPDRRAVGDRADGERRGR